MRALSAERPHVKAAQDWVDGLRAQATWGEVGGGAPCPGTSGAGGGGRLRSVVAPHRAPAGRRPGKRPCGPNGAAGEGDLGGWPPVPQGLVGGCCGPRSVASSNRLRVTRRWVQKSPPGQLGGGGGPPGARGDDARLRLGPCARRPARRSRPVGRSARGERPPGGLFRMVGGPCGIGAWSRRHVWGAHGPAMRLCSCAPAGSPFPAGPGGGAGAGAVRGAAGPSPAGVGLLSSALLGPKRGVCARQQRVLSLDGAWGDWQPPTRRLSPGRPFRVVPASSGLLPGSAPLRRGAFGFPALSSNHDKTRITAASTEGLVCVCLSTDACVCGRSAAKCCVGEQAWSTSGVEEYHLHTRAYRSCQHILALLDLQGRRGPLHSPCQPVFVSCHVDFSRDGLVSGRGWWAGARADCPPHWALGSVTGSILDSSAPCHVLPLGATPKQLRLNRSRM